jgi:hypothetical protein
MTELFPLARRRHGARCRFGSTPIGLSNDGRRVAWAEADGARYRIRAVTLPAR